MAGPDQTRVVRVVVVSGDRSRVLARPNGLAGWQLPALAIAEDRWWGTDHDDAARRLLGGTVAPVRRVGAGGWEAEVVGRLSAAGTTWISHDELGRLGSDAALARAALETEPSPVPHLQPGWRAEIEAWATAALDGATDFSVVRHWELAGVLRARSAHGDVAVKQAGPGFEREVPVTAALAGLPGMVPVHAAEDLRLVTGWAGTVAGPEHRGAVAAAAGRLQRGAIERLASLREAGVVDVVDELPAERDDALTQAWEEVAALDLPDSVVHGDAHPGNAVVDGDRVTLIDWADPAIGCPALDLTTIVGHATDPASPAARAVVGAWAEAMGCAPDPVHRALPALIRVTLHRNIEVVTRLGSVQPPSASAFWDEERRWFQERLAALDETRG